MTQPLGRIVLTLIALGAFVADPVAAPPSVTIAGTVTDASGAVLAGSIVEVLSGDHIETVTTGRDGRYRLELPSEGRYRITVHRDGFTTQTESVTVFAGLRRDFQLAIAPLDDTVVVTASRTPEPRAATTESLVVFTADEIQRSGSASPGYRRIRLPIRPTTCTRSSTDDQGRASPTVHGLCGYLTRPHSTPSWSTRRRLARGSFWRRPGSASATSPARLSRHSAGRR